MMTFGGPNDCLVRWITSTQGTPGSDLFICSHGGWNRRSWVSVPAGGQMWFWCPKDQVISAAVCCDIMRGNIGDQHRVNSIAGGGVQIWDYTLTEFPGDWDNAIVCVQEAFDQRQLQYDCAMINNERAGGIPIRTSTVFAAFAADGYQRYHHMACRV